MFLTMSRQLILVIMVLVLLSACQKPTALTTPETAPIIDDTTTTSAAPTVDLAGIQVYLLEETQALNSSTTELKHAATEYYALAKAVDFDYALLWQQNATEVSATLMAARAAWVIASPGYEKIEGIVAGTPSLAEYDLILDAGSSGADDPGNAVPFDLTLPNGELLPKPGNLFGVTESTLWGTEEAYSSGIEADLDGNGTIDFGENLPDANVLKAGADALDSYVSELFAAGEAWTPTPADAFTALIVMVPTMNEYFASWRDSRFVAGEASTQRDFVAISRLADMGDILGGLEVVYSEVQPLVENVDAAQGEEIAAGLANLKAFVADIYQEEQAGKRYTPEIADLLGAEAQNRATTVTGQINQVAAQLGIAVEE